MQLEVRSGARRRSRIAAACGVTLLTATAFLASAVPASAEDGSILINSVDMANGGALNPMFACSAPGFIPTGGQLSPQLTASLGALGTEPVTLAVVMHDEFGGNAAYDAADGDWVHWLNYNITPVGDAHEVVRNESQNPTFTGGIQGQNSWGETGYRGPCPPPNGTHDYFFTVYALDTTLPTNILTADEFFAAAAGHIIDQGDMHVTFETAEIGTNRAEVELDADMTTIAEGADAVLARLLVNGVLTQDAIATVELNGSLCAPDPVADSTDFSHSGGSTTIEVTIPAGTYTGREGTAIQLPGTLSAVDDLLVENTECITAQLISVSGTEASIGDAAHTDLMLPGVNHQGFALTQSILLIADNDVDAPAPATIEFSSATGSADETAGGTLPVLVVNGTLAADVQVTVTVTGGDATAGTDFTVPTVVTIPVGTYDGTVANGFAIPGFAVTDDTADEADETISFGIVSADEAALIAGDADGDAAAATALTFTIADDDTAPVDPVGPVDPVNPAQPANPAQPVGPAQANTATTAAGTQLVPTGQEGAPQAALFGLLLLAGGAAAVTLRRRAARS